MRSPLPLAMVLAILAGQIGFARADAPRGVPSVDPDYAGDVRDWWAAHPLNPDSARFLAKIESPTPAVNLVGGDSIDEAIAKLPVEGGTIRLAAGRYEPFQIIGRSNVHLLGPDEGEAVVTGRSYLAVSPEAMDYVTYDQKVSHVDSHKYKDARAWELYRKPTRNFYLKNLVFDGEGKTDVDFPGVGIKGPGGALALKRVRDVVVDGCAFRNYLDAKVGLQHCGLAWGHYGLTNVWFRGCRFEGTAKYAVYLDGAHGSGLLGCTIDGKGCKDGGLLFLANHDFTDDLDENGRIDPPEEKCAKFLVLAGNTFLGDFSAPIRITGQNCLVAGNVAKGRMHELVGVYPVGEIAHRNWKPGELKLRVTGNSAGTCARGLVNIFAATPAKIDEIREAPPDVQYTVEENLVEKSPETVRYTPFKP